MNNLSAMKKLLLLASLCLFQPCKGLNAEPQETEGKLTFHLTGFENNSGQAILKLFRQEDKLPSKPSLELKAEIIGNESLIWVDHLPYGEYAVIVVHDKNSNGEIDHTLGIPTEPLRFTNNWHLSLFSGMPSFEKLKFLYNGSHNTITIRMDH
jgi:uncharacterized protein (DUF2141 family)